MSHDHAFDLGKFIPGFDFLQKLATLPPGANALTPGPAGWVAPTVSVEELERRIKELKAVQFWLEQNVTAIKATIQALEVQKMTLAALQGMNLNMTEVAKAFTLSPDTAAAMPPADAPRQATWPYAAAQDAASAPASPPAPAAPPAEEPPAPKPAARARPARKRKPAARAATPKSAAAAAGLADPVQWWNALTGQFQQIAASALRETGSAAALAPAAANQEAADTNQASAASPKAVKKPAVRKKTPTKKPAPRKSRAAKTPSPKAKTAARPSARSALAGWPLPPAVYRRPPQA